MKTKKDFQIDLGKMSVTEVKKHLWHLTYQPQEALSELGVEVEMGKEKETAKEVKNYILQKMKEGSRPFLFAREEPVVSTEGIDIGIKDPVVRDILIEKCSYIVNHNSENLEKVLKLLKTQPENDRYKERIFGGLRSMYFSKEEAEYINQTCNLYPVYLFLEKLTEKREDKQPVHVKVVKETNPEVEPEKTTTAERTLDAVSLIQNQSKINEILAAAEKAKITSFEELKQKKEELGRQQALLEEQMQELDFMEEKLGAIKGAASPEVLLNYLLKNQEIIAELYKKVEAL